MENYKISKSNKLKINIKSKDNVKKILTLLETTLKKKFNKIDITNFINYLDKLNYNNLSIKYNDDIDKINTYISNIYKEDIEKNNNPFDIHEFLKKEINNAANVKNTKEYTFTTVTPPKTSINNQQQIQQNTQSSNKVENNNINMSSFNESLPKLKSKNDQIEFTKILNYESLWRDANILVDSRYQNISNQDRSKMVFTLVGNTKTKVPGTGVITTIGGMRDIVEIEIFPFSIPYLSAADNYYNKITLSILELSSISIEAYENSQYHFMFTAKQSGNLLELTPINKVFRFFKPITRLNEFSIRFGSPLNPIVFDKDRLYTASIDYTANPGTITFSEPHNLITGDLIYITDFETKNNAEDLNIITEINNPQGHICTRLSNTTISINVDFSQIIVNNRPLAINNYPNSSNPQDLSVIVYFGSKRILMPLRIRYLLSTVE